MIIYPSIELCQGHCAQIHDGSTDAETVLEHQPAHIAQHWAAQGAEWLHVVNLDGALNAKRAHIDALQYRSNILVQHPGELEPVNPHDKVLQELPPNLQGLHAIRQAVAIPIQFAGGLHTVEDIELAFVLGANRVVLGTAGTKNQELVHNALNRWGDERVVVQIDARRGKVMTHGWPRSGEIDAVDLGHHIRSLGIKRVIYVDSAHSGPLESINLEDTARLGDMTDLRVIASGNVKDLGDITALKAREHYNIEGVVVGQPIYTGKLDVAQAVEAGHQPLSHHSAGIIPFRAGEDGPEFLLLFNLFFEQWQFPRGGAAPNESNIECARREFKQETNLPIVQIHDECEVKLEYTASIRSCEIHRTIVYYLADIGPGRIELGNENHCEACWLTPQETWELLTETSPEQLPALDAALAYLKVPLD